MVNLWERSIPVYDIGMKELESIFTEYDRVIGNNELKIIIL